MSMQTETIYEVIEYPDELKAVKSHRFQMFCACIILFLIVCFQSYNSWQQTGNEYALHRENENLRLRLTHEQRQRRMLEATLAAKEAKP